VNEVKPVKQAASPLQAFSLWLAVTLLSSLLLLAFSDHRSDMDLQMQSSLFLAESASLLLLIISTAFAAVWLSYPDLRQKKWVLYLPLPWLVLYFALTVWRFIYVDFMNIADEDMGSGFACVLCITLYSVVPGLWMFFTLRKYATTRPFLTGAISMLASASVGILVLKFAESNDSVQHLMLWHLLPALILGLGGAYLGRKFLSW
jgi:hypothetical protein